MKIFERFFGKRFRVSEPVLEDYRQALDAYQRTIHEIDGVNESIKILCKDPAYKKLLDLVHEKTSLAKTVAEMESSLHDIQTKIAGELGVLPQRIHDYTINTRTGRVKLKGD